MALVELRSLCKNFGAVKAADNVSLDIESGEFITLLGPSGSGKTTVLRLIAGFENPDSGSIHLSGKDITHLPPFDRDVNTVFQDYALFPHMTALVNVEYGLRTRKVPKDQRTRQAREAIAAVKLEHATDRLPHQLSGGQRQRIALARAMVLRPKVLLLDEPLGALDRRLREEMQEELKSIQRDAGITFIFVTHDQEEAMRMSDRIVIFNEGRIEQVGTPRDLYERPSTAFVAGFVGVANLFDEDISESLFGRRAVHTLRPERVRVLPASSSEGHAARVVEAQYLGAEIRLTCKFDAGGNVIASIPSTRERAMQRDELVKLSWDPQAVFEVTDKH
ncbi:MAG: ABC transporter ATP-binding protein [Actinomycetota bacterium]